MDWSSFRSALLLEADNLVYIATAVDIKLIKAKTPVVTARPTVTVSEELSGLSAKICKEIIGVLV